MKKALAAFFCAIFLLTGCRMAPGVEDTPSYPLEGEMTGIYRKTAAPVPEGYRLSVDSDLRVEDGCFTVTAYQEDKDGSLFVDINTTLSFDRAGNPVVVSEEENGTLAPADERARIDRRWRMEDGTVLFTEILNTETMYSVNLSARDGEGTLLFTVDVPQAMEYEIAQDKRQYNTSGEVFTYLDVVWAEDCYVILTTEGLCALDQTGGVRWTTREKGEGAAALGLTNAGLLTLINGSLRMVRLSDGALEMPLELPAELRGGGAVYLPEGDGLSADGASPVNFDFYLKNNAALWGIFLEKTEDGRALCRPTVVIDWAGSCLTASEVVALSVLDAKTVAAVVKDALSDQPPQALLLTMMTPEEIPEKEIIRLALFSNGAVHPYAVRKFNETSEEYRIVVTDYTVYETAEDRQIRLNVDMAAGKGPDILVHQRVDSLDFTLTSYIESGLFCDLLPLMEASPDFPAEDLLGYVTKPYRRADGTQPVFPLAPITETRFGREEYVTGPMTAEEWLAMYDDLPAGVRLVNWQNRLGDDILTGIMEDFMNRETGTCSFDTGRFAGLLSRALAIPAAPEGILKTAGERYAAVREGKLRFVEERVHTLRRWVELSEQLGGRPVPVGYPNDGGALLLSDTSEEFFAVTESSRHKEEAFRYLTIAISTANAMPYATPAPLFGRDIDRMLAECNGMTLVYGENGSRFLPDAQAEAAEGVKRKVTEEDAAEYRAFLDDVDGSLRRDTPAYGIYNEEIWNESRSPEDTARVIQSRISIYLAEIQ